LGIFPFKKNLVLEYVFKNFFTVIILICRLGVDLL